MTINEQFFDLIRVALGRKVCLSHSPSACEWGELYAMAKKQSLVGVCFAGVQKLYNDNDNDDDDFFFGRQKHAIAKTARFSRKKTGKTVFGRRG